MNQNNHHIIMWLKEKAGTCFNYSIFHAAQGFAHESITGLRSLKSKLVIHTSYISATTITMTEIHRYSLNSVDTPI